MIRNYLKIAFRNLVKHKTNTIINLLGLTVAFTICLLLVISVYYEFSYNKYHVNGKDIYRPYFSQQTPEGKQLQPTMPEPMLKALKDQYSAVKYGSRYKRMGCELEYNGKHYMKQITYVDADFFRMFTFPLIKGNAVNALESQNSIVLNEEVATAMFGEEDPIGKQVRMQAGGEWKVFMVSGVGEKIPENSSFGYQAAIRFENDDNYPNVMNEWESTNHDLFIQLAPGTDPRKFEAGLQAFINKQYESNINDLKRDGARPTATGQYLELLMQPFLKMHTDTSMRGVGTVISRTYLNMLLAVACFVMLIACFNFINLSVGRSFTRSREVGLRKTLGAMPRQVAIQFWGEAALICLLSLAISVPLFYFLLPHYRELFGSSVTTHILFQPSTIACIFGCFLLITIIAGGYPAWIMTRMDAVKILKGKLRLKTSGSLRNGLIISQFAIAILLISCTLVTWKQLNYLRNQPLGYNSSQIVSIPVGTEVDGRDALQLLRQKLTQEPAVLGVTGLSTNLGVGLDGGSYSWGTGFDYKERAVNMAWMNVGYDFVKTMDLKLISGRDFSPAFSTDSNSIVINEQMARQLGEKDPIGVKLVHDTALAPMTVIGVVKDFNFQSLHTKVEPLGLVMYKPMPVNVLLVKVSPQKLPVIMDKLKAVWKEISPRTDFKGSFLDENINRQYDREERFTRIFVYAAIVAIVLSCLGLFALAILAIMQRTKEIGIRKALGASAGNIVQLITRDFVKLIFIAMVIATPTAYYFMNKWLEGFAFSIEIKWWWLLSAGLLALAVALCTIGYQSLKAALTNPVKSLKSE
ncbi:ABC transporter permease [Chitinophaga sp. SYP-B3965]|uniref:ABC transporter permease n=1 Tax=Chitinophaga sp. SYP-B3965 TaxID=2663120 RepID=UPI001564F94A|nr:ABC transporter permease [Chitinophaga sp. SYP-B3965]